MIRAIDRLFERLGATYGASWEHSIGNAPISDVKTVWAHELEPFKGSLHRLAWALENLPEHCPNVIQFKKLCRMAPSPEVEQLPEPKADPARVAAELAKLAPLRAQAAQPKQKDYREWARIILANPAGRSSAAIQMAKNALEAQ